MILVWSSTEHLTETRPLARRESLAVVGLDTRNIQHSNIPQQNLSTATMRFILFITCLSLVCADTWDDGFDRVGGDLPNQPVVAINAQHCESLCRDEPACRGWSYDKCFRNSLDDIQWNIDYPYEELQDAIILSSKNDSSTCHSICLSTRGCVGWVVDACGLNCWLKKEWPQSSYTNYCRGSFHFKNGQGNRCWLKGELTTIKPFDCSISGQLTTKKPPMWILSQD
ncbi:hypothetical protein PROFUN_12736 [Planoprotostelium fungivorum]|uniref:Apple domain-containing protein n=1 Tax=Planoprotostelium fungivorum TaxID=1890364 RepID=A0A2P6N8J2_9EUKA|nr:hypothetical protein PROFUN_12736 [Planoprotostelium fungivorum]